MLSAVIATLVRGVIPILTVASASPQYDSGYVASGTFDSGYTGSGESQPHGKDYLPSNSGSDRTAPGDYNLGGGYDYGGQGNDLGYVDTYGRSNEKKQ